MLTLRYFIHFMRAHNREASVITAVHADLTMDRQKALEVPKSI